MINPPTVELPPNPAHVMWDEYTQPWLALSDDERAWAMLAEDAVYVRYCLAKKYGPQLYNYITNGGMQV